MSAAAAGIPRAPRRAWALPRLAPEAALRIAAFGGLAAFVCGHWAAMVAEPPVLRMVVVVSVATGLAAALAALTAAKLTRPATIAVAVGALLLAAALALAAAGLPVRLLPPGAWDELGPELDRGLSGIRTVEWPYAGDERWVRLVILLAAPAALVLAAALAFWPARRGRGTLRALGLVVLLALYGTAVTEHDPGSPLPRGLALFVLVAAWLWLPRLRAKEAGAAAVTVLAVGLLALPAAARLDGETAVIDYQSWNWFGGKDVTFDWSHSYGPLDWPREGTTLLHVRSDRPLYWKAETLDTFDGFRWLRSRANDDTRPAGELPDRPNQRWIRDFRVTVRALSTDFVVGAGTPFTVDGVGNALAGSSDGTIRKFDEPLSRGDSYRVRAYVPEPSARAMRAASPVVEPALGQYTKIALPPRGTTALDGNRRQGDAARSAAGPAAVVSVPLRDSAERDPEAGAALAGSPYGDTFRLARQLVAGAPTTYEAVRRVERHLERSYTYSERPPSQEFPLEAFLFEDRIGYCQQFSGAMALMLRMTGIPARVVSGFSPGSFNRDSREYRVRDLDAHSWVEVYFGGIGWVTFDPTPSGPPAARAASERAGAAGERAGAASSDSSQGGGGASDRSLDPAGGASGDDGGGELELWMLPAVLFAAGLLVAGGLAIRSRRAGRRRGEGAAEAGLRELERALVRLGWPVSPGTTLLQLERRLGRTAGPGAAGYVARLRESRFSGRGPRPPGRAARRALRRDLTAARGPVARLRGFLVLPPRGPAV